MTASSNAYELIRRFEGCYLKAYKCPGGVWTIGYGHTRGVWEGLEITIDTAEELLQEDVKEAENRVNKYMDKYRFNQQQFDALVSFAFNVGSIDGLTKNGTRSIEQIRNAMLLYVRSNGVILKGLENRRREELNLFVSDVTTSHTLFEGSHLFSKIKKVSVKPNYRIRKDPIINNVNVIGKTTATTLYVEGIVVFDDSPWMIVNHNGKVGYINIQAVKEWHG